MNHKSGKVTKSPGKVLPGKKDPLYFAFLLFMVLYLAGTFLVMALHEPWEDELHAWILSRELGFFQLFNHMKYEGHFCLWHWILRLFSSNGAEVLYLNLISYLFCTAGVLFFAEKAPFPRWVKILFFLSFPLFYFFPAVARPYAMIPILLWALAYCYPLRHKKPFCYGGLLALMIQTHAYMEGFCGILSLLFFVEILRKKRKEPWREKAKALSVFLLIGGSFLLGLLQVAGTFAVCCNAPKGNLLEKLANLPGDIGHYPVEFARSLTYYTGEIFVLILLGGAFLTGMVLLYLKSGKAFLIALCSIASQILFSVWIYPMALQRIYLPMLILVFCFWIVFRKQGKGKNGEKKTMYCAWGILLLLSILTFPDTFLYTQLEISRPFSNIESTSCFIRKNLPRDAKILVYPPELLSGAFGAFLPEYTFISSGNGKAFRYFLYEKNTGKKPDRITDETLEKFPFTREGTFYILLQAGMIRAYKLDLRDPDRIFTRYRIRVIHVPAVPSFFSAGEDYLILKADPL
jgi:hypothetical protein